MAEGIGNHLTGDKQREEPEISQGSDAITPAPQTRLRYAADLRPDATEQPMIDMALAFLGIGTLAPSSLSETASWDRTGHDSMVGRAEILAAMPGITAPVSVTVTQIVSEGKAATITGRLTRDGIGVALFCLVLRFTSPTRDQIAQVVGFEQAELT
ncbi:hypothetical protein [Celeribacter neptunius]|uniref:SnoaL-like domain-containing protein n=1 Tax=Celeribacter neptunius TaxID=588602 RepID=A0A1I3WGB3_9RHOB|nr:hypothetical protein [Celeribacter neptunius]SFK06598.1 hypothetical protein SAMN04487991_3739 [Celeribacter neptunius]